MSVSSSAYTWSESPKDPETLAFSKSSVFIGAIGDGMPTRARVVPIAKPLVPWVKVKQTGLDI